MTLHGERLEVVNGQVTYNPLYGNLVGATNPAAIIIMGQGMCIRSSSI